MAVVDADNPGRGNIFRRCWRGEETLSRVGWVSVALGIGVATLQFVTFAAAVRAGLAGGAGVIAHLLGLPFDVWVGVAVWRSAFNTGWRGWGFLARGCVILGAAMVIVGFFPGAYRFF